jgi:uncharacterized membrane protein HdeD (DUF308 family)
VIDSANTSPQIALATRRKWLLALGILLAVLGIAGLGVVSFLELTSLLVFGTMLLASSVLQIVVAFAVEGKKESLLHLAAAGLEMALAFFIMMNPPERLIGLMTLIAVFLIAIGLARVARSMVRRSGERAGILVTGVIALLLGLSVWIGGPTAKLGFVGACLAIDFLCHGASWLVVALMERKAVQDQVS